MCQIVQWGWETGQTKPKTTSSEGVVALDADSVVILRRQIAVQDADRAPLGGDWQDFDQLFPHPDGSPWHPAEVTEVFHLTCELAGLPPIRLHDLRHGAATLALAAGVEMKVVQHMLRHSSAVGPQSRAPLGPATDHKRRCESARTSSGNHKNPG